MAKGFFHRDNGRIVILKDKRKLLAEVDAAVKKAPVKAKRRWMLYEGCIRTKYDIISTMIFGYFKDEVRARTEKRKEQDSESVHVNETEVPVSVIEFEISEGCTVKVFNEKAYLIEFRERVAKTQETMKRPAAKVRKTPSSRPVAAEQEIIGKESLVKVNRKGWFTDGHVLIKGEVPKGAAEPKGRPVDLPSFVGEYMEYDKTRFARLQYYCLSDPGIGTVVSRNPVLQFGKRQRPYVVFKIDGRYVVYIQGIFRAVKNRYPDAEYRICPDNGMLVAYENRKPVAGLMSYQAGGRYHTQYPTQMYVPPLRDEAIKAGFLKEKRKALEI